MKAQAAAVPSDAGIFWVPLIALFSGARSGEIIQLYVSDVREDGGIPFLDINRDGTNAVTDAIPSVPPGCPSTKP